jgi:tRNA pseudouridine55 synthase
MNDGLIILDKPAGMTSARAVSAVKRLLPREKKLGHAGTLDPFATGVLVLLMGRATRLCELIMGWPKTYEATIKLGATTATDDIESPEQSGDSPAAPIQFGQIEQALAKFVGAIPQYPPVYSAIKLRGKRACDRVRKGEKNLQLQPRIVQVHSIELLSYMWPLLHVRIECGRGTYIRSIARDLGAALTVGGYLTALRRTRIGQCTIERAVRLEQLTHENIEAHVISMPTT